MRTIAVTLLLTSACLAAFGQGADSGRLTAKVKPGRAGVFVDGKYLGPAANFRIAKTYVVAPGEHEVKLVDPRYEEFVTKVNIQPGKKTTLNQTLKPLPAPQPPFGIVRTQHADKFAAVFVNGKYCGHADEFSNFAQGLQLNPGEYEVKVVPASGAPVIQKVKVEADKAVVVK